MFKFVYFDLMLGFSKKKFQVNIYFDEFVNFSLNLNI